MSFHSDTLSWFRDNQSLLFLLNAVCLVEKQPDQGSNPWFTTLEPANHYTIDAVKYSFIINRNQNTDNGYSDCIAGHCDLLKTDVKILILSWAFR